MVFQRGFLNVAIFQMQPIKTPKVWEKKLKKDPNKPDLKQAAVQLPTILRNFAIWSILVEARSGQPVVINARPTATV